MAEQLRSFDLTRSEPLTRGKMIELARSHVYLNTPKNYHECTKTVDKGKSAGVVWHGNARSFEINEMQWILQ